MGVCHNFPRALVYSSLKYAGLGIQHLHTIQEITRLKDILQHNYANTITGHLYRTSLEYLILELGMGTSLHQVDYERFNGLVTNSLVKSTWEFINHHKITLVHDIVVPQNMTGGVLLMPILCQKDLQPQELKAINQCRLYLNAYYLSDIATASGKSLSYHAWEGTPRFEGSTSLCNWPFQGYPSKSAWSVWRKTLTMSILGRGMNLKDNLGAWLRHDLDRWKRHYSPQLDSLIYTVSTDTYMAYNKTLPVGNRKVFTSTDAHLSVLPKILLKASVKKTRKNLWWVIDLGQHLPPVPTVTFDSYQDFLVKTTHKNQWCFDHVEVPPDHHKLLQDVQEGHIWLVSDGSYDPRLQYGTATWILEG
jgi:hypothetical protein